MRTYTNKRPSRKNHTTRALLIAGLAAVMAIALAGAGYAVWHKYRTKHQKPSQSPSSQTATINFSPPTQQETNAANSVKDNTPTKTPDQPNSSQTATPPASSQPAKRSVKPIIVSVIRDSSNVTVRSFVPDIIEDNGQCTTTFTQGQQTVTKQSTAFADVNKTTCAPMVVPVSQIGPGAWSVAVSYSSSASAGVSDASTL